MEGWPGAASVSLFRLNGGLVVPIAHAGDRSAVRAWASVSKMAVSLSFGIEVDWGMHALNEPMGPPGATLANLLSHSSGLGLEESDPVVGVGIKRIYSNIGIDLAVTSIVEDNPPALWLEDRLFSPMGMSSTRLVGRPCSGLQGSLNDLERLALAWLRPDIVSLETQKRFITPYLAELDGIVPGFGKFSPCPWGLGPEIHGTKQHWMGSELPAQSFGHFGQSGAMMLLDPVNRIGLVALSDVAFGPWAVSLWPQWTNDMHRRALAS